MEFNIADGREQKALEQLKARSAADV